MSSQETTQIRLTNTVTGEKVTFDLSKQATPALGLKLNKRDRQIERYAALTEGLQEGDKAPKEAAELLNGILNSGLDALCMILELSQLPEGYQTKRDVISDCMENLAVVNVVIEVFYKALSDSTASPEASELRKKAVAAVEVLKP